MLKNDDGVDFLAMKLAVVLVAAAIVLIFAAECSLALIAGMSASEARACAGRIAGIALAEYAEGCPGAGDGATTEVTVPGNVRMIVFGTAQANDQGNPCSCMYTITYRDGTNETYITGVPLGDGNPGIERGRPVSLHPGRYIIHIRVEPVGSRMMALLYQEAA